MKSSDIPSADEIRAEYAASDDPDAVLRKYKIDDIRDIDPDYKTLLHDLADQVRTLVKRYDTTRSLWGGGRQIPADDNLEAIRAILTKVPDCDCLECDGTRNRHRDHCSAMQENHGPFLVLHSIGKDCWLLTRDGGVMVGTAQADKRTAIRVVRENYPGCELSVKEDGQPLLVLGREAPAEPATGAC